MVIEFLEIKWFWYVVWIMERIINFFFIEIGKGKDNGDKGECR